MKWLQLMMDSNFSIMSVRCCLLLVFVLMMGCQARVGSPLCAACNWRWSLEAFECLLRILMLMLIMRKWSPAETHHHAGWFTHINPSANWFWPECFDVQICIPALRLFSSFLLFENSKEDHSEEWTCERRRCFHVVAAELQRSAHNKQFLCKLLRRKLIAKYYESLWFFIWGSNNFVFQVFKRDDFCCLWSCAGLSLVLWWAFLMLLKHAATTFSAHFEQSSQKQSQSH